MVDTNKLISSNPRQLIVAFPFLYREKDKELLAKFPLETTEIDLTEVIENVSFSHTKTSPSGTFNITLLPTEDWRNFLKPGDWLMIYNSQVKIERGTTKGLMCLGNIDRISVIRHIDPTTGALSVRYKIDGRDFGKIFEKAQFYYNPYVQRGDSSVQNFVISHIGNKMIGKPEEVIQAYFEVFFGNGVFNEETTGIEGKTNFDKLNQLRLPPAIFREFGVEKINNKLHDLVRFKVGNTLIPKGTIKLRDFLKGKTDPFIPDGVSINLPMDDFIHGNFWNLIHNMANNGLNELYTSMEYYPLEDKIFPTLIIRKIPFRQGLYTKIPKMQVPTNMITDEDVGYSDHERINFMMLNTNNPSPQSYIDGIATWAEITKDDNSFKIKLPSGTITSILPYCDPESIMRHGYSNMTIQTDYPFAVPDDPKTLTSEKDNANKVQIQKFALEIVETWKDVHRTESGTIVLKGLSRNFSKLLINDVISVGNNIYLTDKNRLYHIEAFTKTWTSPGHQEIVLTVSRGVYLSNIHNKDYQFLDEITQWVGYEKQIPTSYIKR